MTEVVSSSLFVYLLFANHLGAYCRLLDWTVYVYKCGHGTTLLMWKLSSREERRGELTCLGTVRNNRAECETSLTRPQIRHFASCLFFFSYVKLCWKPCLCLYHIDLEDVVRIDGRVPNHCAWMDVWGCFVQVSSCRPDKAGLLVRQHAIHRHRPPSLLPAPDTLSFTFRHCVVFLAGESFTWLTTEGGTGKAEKPIYTVFISIATLFT